MQPFAVVEPDNVVGDISDGFGMVRIVTLPYALHFEIQEETLDSSSDTAMSTDVPRVIQIGQNQGVQISNDVALQTSLNFLG